MFPGGPGQGVDDGATTRELLSVEGEIDEDTIVLATPELLSTEEGIDVGTIVLGTSVLVGVIVVGTPVEGEAVEIDVGIMAMDDCGDPTGEEGAGTEVAGTSGDEGIAEVGACCGMVGTAEG